MTYAVLEIQTDASGNMSIVTPIKTIKPEAGESDKQTRNRAEAEYHRILSAAAESPVFEHSAMLINQRGGFELSQCYDDKGATKSEG